MFNKAIEAVITLVVIIGVLVVIGVLKERSDKKKKKLSERQNIIDRIRQDIKEKKIKFITARDLVLEYGFEIKEAEEIIEEVSKKFFGTLDVDEKGSLIRQIASLHE